jgi:hypothetical protein
LRHSALQTWKPVRERHSLLGSEETVATRNPTPTLVGDNLSQTVDNVHAAFFARVALTRVQREEAARAIAARQGLPRAYANMFALSDAERKAGIQVFTGERMTSASARHIGGEEACVALLELDVKARDVRAALARATEGMLTVLHRLDSPRQRVGVYCCAKCCVSVWRHLSAGGLDHAEERLTRGLHYLRKHRGEAGEWRRFPFAYTVFALSAIAAPEAKQELRFAARTLERKLARKPAAERFAQRRHAVFARALEQL